MSSQVKEEGWYLVAGDPDTQELLALRRVGLEDRTTGRSETVRYGAVRTLASSGWQGAPLSQVLLTGVLKGAKDVDSCVAG